MGKFNASLSKSKKKDVPLARKGSNKYMTKARGGKNDEFYTMLPDIEKELKNYKKHLMM